MLMNNNLLSSLNIAKIASNLNKILETVNKVIPLYTKVKPIISNAPTLNNILNMINTPSKKDNIIKETNKKVSNNLPTFFQ